MSERYRVVFFGTEKFAARIVTALIESPHTDVVAVVTQPPRPVGRKQELTPSAVNTIASVHGIPTLTPETLKDSAVHDALRECNADIFVVAQYGLIIPRAILDIPAHGAVNVHGSLLPRHRGASPVQTALREGDTETGITFMVMDEKMDHGPLLQKFACEIHPDDTTETLLARLAEIAAAHIDDAVLRYMRGELVAVPQDHDAATFTKLFSRADAEIHWDTQAAAEIERMLRAYTPWPGISMKCGDDLTCKIIEARVATDVAAPAPGILFMQDKRLFVGAANGSVLEILKIQPAGKQPMAAQAFWNGYGKISQ